MKYKVYVEETNYDEEIEWVYHGTWDNKQEALEYIHMIEENGMRTEWEEINENED